MVRRNLLIGMAVIGIAIAPKAGAVNWTGETVDRSEDGGRDGSSASDKDGLPHISYLDETDDGLKFAMSPYSSPGPFSLLSPANGAWANPEPLFQWEASSPGGAGLSRYELWINGVWNTNVPNTQPLHLHWLMAGIPGECLQ